MSILHKIKDGFRKFMVGRRGADELSLALLIAGLVLSMLTSFTRIGVFYLVGLVAYGLSIFRMFSRNIEKRSRENQAFLRLLGRAGSANVTNPFENMSFGNVQKPEPDKKYVKCPKCKATLRVPRQKGKHTVRCPRCDNRFKIRIFIGAKNK